MRLLFVLLIVLSSTFSLKAQDTPQLPNDVSEAEVKARLIQRGYDPDNIDPENLEAFQQEFEEVVAELEQEKEFNSENNTDDFISDSLDNISEEVDENTVEIEKDVSKINEDKIEEAVVDLDKEEVQNDVNETTSVDEAITDNISEDLNEKLEEVNIYGHDLFYNSGLKFYRTSDSNVTPPNYILSSGDEIMVSIFGNSQVDLNYKIDRNGNINAKRIGKIYLKGLNYENAEKLLRKRFARTYSFLPEQFKLTLQAARTVNVVITGEVVQPGTYNVSALNSALNTLLAAGGPLKTGTVRKIVLYKADTGEKKLLDVYKFLANPDSFKNFSIDNNDIIHVPLSENIVSISGPVKRGMRYELLSNETLSDLVDYAGGFNPQANKKAIMIARIVDDGKKIIDIPYSQANSFTMNNLDNVKIRATDLNVEEYVSIRGRVNYPGRFEYKSGMTLASILDKSQFSKYARKDILFIYRHGEDGLMRLEKVDLSITPARTVILNPLDQVAVLDINYYQDEPIEIEISGAVRHPKTIKIKDNQEIKISDLVSYAGGLKDNAYPRALVVRYDKRNNQWVDYKKIDIYNAINNPNSFDNLLLKEGDKITVFTNEYFNNKGFNVTLKGDVKNETTVNYDKSLTVNDLFMLSGGVNETANNKAIVRRRPIDNNIDVEYLELDIESARNGVSDFKLEPRDEIIVYNKNEFKERFTVNVLGEVNRPGSYNYGKSLTINKLIYMSGGLTPKAAGNNVNIYRLEFRENQSNLVLHKQLKIIEENGNYIASENITIAPYDIIIIRPIPDYKLQQVVYVTGEVMYPGPYVINDEVKLSTLVERAGGLTKRAFPLGAKLTRNKGVARGPILINLKDAMDFGKNHEDIPVLPGDELFIPQNEDIVSIKIAGTNAENVYVSSLFKGEKSFKTNRDSLALDEDITNLSQDSLIVDDRAIQISYQGKKSAKWYIDHFAGGFTDNIDKKSVRVIEPTGRVRSTRRVLGLYDYPTVIKGSTIALDYKNPKSASNNSSKKKFNLSDTLKEILTITSSAVTIIALAKTINQ